jgi:hypothetical protein
MLKDSPTPPLLVQAEGSIASASRAKQQHPALSACHPRLSSGRRRARACLRVIRRNRVALCTASAHGARSGVSPDRRSSGLRSSRSGLGSGGGDECRHAMGPGRRAARHPGPAGHRQGRLPDHRRQVDGMERPIRGRSGHRGVHLQQRQPRRHDGAGRRHNGGRADVLRRPADVLHVLHGDARGWRDRAEGLGRRTAATRRTAPVQYGSKANCVVAEYFSTLAVRADRS